MQEQKSKNLLYLSLILFVAFFLTIFNITLNFIDIIRDFFQTYTNLPVMEFVFNFSYILLLWFILLIYRRWRNEFNERKKDEEALLSLRAAVSNMQIGVTVTNPDGKIIFTNQADAEMHGYSTEELIGKDARIFSPQTNWKPMFQPVRKRFKRESINIRKDGTTFPVYLMSDIVMNNRGEIIAKITTCEDVSERKRNEETIRNLAFYDSLTGLPNRSLFIDRMLQELAKAKRQRQMMAVIFIDLDRFKVINDTLGHATGDLLLQAVAKQLKESIREGDTVSRLGGDEFLLLFPDITQVKDASFIAEKIVHKFSEAFMVNDKELYISASLGISIFPDNSDSTETLIKHADTAMYYAKQQGRNNYQFYSPKIDAYTTKKIEIEANLRKAIANNELMLYYQPQFNLTDGKITGAEALLRWQNLEQGAISPAEFIPIAEETGLIQPIGEWIFRTVCRQIKQWQEARLQNIRISVNVSMNQFRQNNFIEILIGILKEMDIQPDCIEVEITESAIMHDTGLTTTMLNELRSHGIKIAIDDFGTGYSSLSYLKYLPISRLKLDQSFVHSLGINPNDEAISRAIIAMAHSLSLQVVAEGVENADQLMFLKTYDCDEVQGFLFSKALAADDFIKFVDSYNNKSIINDKIYSTT
ncbi:MAG: EAL domain-containing protein [Nitrospira sp.]|nr:EAL domain-containing protein [Nitrospira sp.]